jgi:hypothetical protein
VIRVLDRAFKGQIPNVEVNSNQLNALQNCRSDLIRKMTLFVPAENLAFEELPDV